MNKQETYEEMLERHKKEMKEYEQIIETLKNYKDFIASFCGTVGQSAPKKATENLKQSKVKKGIFRRLCEKFDIIYDGL